MCFDQCNTLTDRFFQTLKLIRNKIQSLYLIWYNFIGLSKLKNRDVATAQK